MFELFSTALAGPSPGDFDANGVVDAADFTTWRDGLGSEYSMADYDVWKSHFGAGGEGGAGETSPSNASVPEPASVLLVAIALIAVYGRHLLLWRMI